MANKDCTCGGRFMDAEDFRDHLPCEGTEDAKLVRELLAELQALRIVAAAAEDLLVDMKIRKREYWRTRQLATALSDLPLARLSGR